MAGTGVGKFSSTAGSNTSNLTVNFAENMAPSNVNNAARELMGHMRDMYEQLGDGYFEFGDGDGTYTVARSDADTITITSSSDISSVYFAGRKIRITDGGANVAEGTIASSSHSSTTQTVNLTGISLASGTPTKVELGIDTASFGGRVILDDDGDTYIEAPTDDTIDIYVAGAKDFVITANTFTAESGSTIAAQALTATSITSTGNIIIPDAGNIGSASDTDSIAIASDGVVTFSQAPVFPDGSIAVADLDIDGATDIGEAIVDADLLLLDDGAGGTIRKTTASRLKTYIGGNEPSSADGQALGSTSLEWSDLYLADGGIIYFGNDQEIKVTHVADTGLTLKHTATADDKPVALTLQTGETDIAANDVIGKIDFQAPDEGTGTDAILVAAGIEAVSEGDFSSSNNATKLSFKTAASEAAAEKMSLSSAGLLTIADDLVIGDGKTIGSASDADAIAIASNGVVTFSQAPVFPDGSINIADIDLDGGTDIGAAIVDADLFLIDDGAGGTMRKTTASRLKTYAGGGGKVLQVQHAASTTEASSNNDSTFVDTGLTDDITPANAGGPAVMSLRLMRGTTEVEQWNAVGAKENQGGNWMFQHLDSPSTTSATTYHTEFKRLGDSLAGTVYINDDRYSGTQLPNSTITLIEIDGT